ncbi:MAG: neutral/alkaline non-lysosomal ceramidase N-terminal domain-containing protein [Deltaproteobacteria bacterium]|nr:neutral/alkaline non-lysosomal ceramidase N-terminal domain-containing protein [Deltaproteobacteria bacterium]
MSDTKAHVWGLSRRAVLKRLSSRIVVTVKRRVPREPTANGVVCAGAAVVDITPPPGLPMAGYSLMGRPGEGVRTRLKARAIYLRPAKGRPVALVVCDLLSGSTLLHHRVAELVAGTTDVDLAGLMVCGTHTHSAPGNFFESVFYNAFASGAPGFDQDLYRFLSNKLARVITDAFKDAKPARLASGRIRVPGVAVNRSPGALAQNRYILEETSQIAGVNPWMHLVRIDCRAEDGTFYPRAAFSAFSIHPTALDPKNRLYNGDIFATVERYLARRVKKRVDPPWEFVHAAANHTHADTTPRFLPGEDGGFAEARRLGEKIGHKAARLFFSLEGDLSKKARIRVWAEEFNVQKSPRVEEFELSRPAVGLALTAGSTTRSTPILRHLPFFAPGWPKRVFTGSGQGAKRVAGGVFQPLFLRTGDFPRRLFLQVLHIQDTVFLPLPFEISCQAGLRIQERARRAFPETTRREPPQVVCISCANGYWGYVTTPEEYSMQYYEGGHTLYGPDTQPFLAAHAARAVNSLVKGKPGRPFPDTFTFPLSPARYWPKPRENGRPRPTALGPPLWETDEDEPCLCFSWRDAPPGGLPLDRPLVKIEIRKKGGDWQPLVIDHQPVDDEGEEISIRLAKHAKDEPRAIWEARWHNPRGPANSRCRFVILTGGHAPPLYSMEFVPRPPT